MDLDAPWIRTELYCTLGKSRRVPCRICLDAVTDLQYDISTTFFVQAKVFELVSGDDEGSKVSGYCERINRASISVSRSDRRRWIESSL
jgi:hypothetical protein